MGAATPVTSIRDLAPMLNPRKMLYQVRLEEAGRHLKRRKETHKAGHS